MNKIELSERGVDPAGDGSWQASRGDRVHNGIDYLCSPEQIICSPVAGRLTKIGYPYANDYFFRYVQITDDAGYQHRIFYCDAVLPPGAQVEEGQAVGIAQDILSKRGSSGTLYRDMGMKNHVHYEVKLDGEFLEPEAALQAAVLDDAEVDELDDSTDGESDEEDLT